MIGRTDVTAAASRITGWVRRTPVAEVEPSAFGVPVWLKLEFLQHSGSFKPRGMFNRILAARESGELTAAGVITASGGNAALAVAHVAARLGVPAEVYVPENAPEVKVRRLRALGAEVVQAGQEYSEAYDAARKREADTGRLFCHAYDQPDVVAGQGTLALELQEQIDGFDTVLVAVGGGGLIGGIAAALEGAARVVGVEPTRAATMHAALAAGRPVDVPVGGVAADSLGARRLGQVAFDVAVRCGVTGVLVSDADLIATRRMLWHDHRVVVELGAAAALAALRTGAYAPEPGERVVVVLCGANTDPSDLAVGDQLNSSQVGVSAPPRHPNS
ncbi:MAG TPA: threonine/serine dehydratase [Pilimelia sp.]|nr:threonine/serine dehydratase [Pilimelia sp.]